MPEKVTYLNTDWNKEYIRNLLSYNKCSHCDTHKALIMLCINLGDFSSDTRDYEELSFVVPKYWLVKILEERYAVVDLYDWLMNKYTSEESETIFVEALNNHKIVLIDFT